MRRSLARLLPYVRRARRDLLLGLVCAILATGFAYLSPWVLKLVIDDLLAGRARGRLVYYSAALVVLSAADGSFRYLMRKWVIGASRQIEYDLRNAFFARLQELPLGYLQGARTGDLMSRATNDLSAVRMMIGPAVMYLSSTALGLVIALALMFSIDARLTALVLVPMPFVTIATRMFGRAIHDRFERIQAQLSDMSAVVQEALAGVRVVRAYGQEAHEIATFKASNDEYVRRNARLIHLQSAFYPSLTMCFGVSGILMLWLGGREVISHRLTLGEFVALSRYLVMLSWPMIAFGWVINITQRGVASWERMLEVMDAADATGAAGAAGATGASGAAGAAIEIEHLTFAYPSNGRDVLHDISLSVAPGETVAIVGPTGSGKSTLINLLPRLFDPPKGTIFIDGVDVCDRSLDDVRGVMAIVPQEPFLFSESIAGNIGFALGGVPAGDERLRAAAHAACLDEEVAGFAQGLETVIGERGITLSGGQKQRTAIARAVAADARLLILDDALSAVDTRTEDALLQRLTAVRRGRTCLMVAHRVSTVRHADRILVLVDGRVAESGTHDALAAAGGTYADMCRRQRLEEEISQA